MNNPETNPNATPARQVKSAKKPILATTEAGLLQQAITMNDTWKKNPDYIIRWITQTDYAAQLTILSKTIGDKKGGKGDKTDFVAEMQELDDKIDDDVITLKAALKVKYKKDSKARVHYGKFGIDFSRGFFSISRDRDERLAALDQVLSGLEKENLTNLEEGLTYWTANRDKYKALYKLTTGLKGDISLKVSETNRISDIMRKGLNSMVHLIKSWHPDEYVAVLRSWSFQRENY